MCDLAWWNFSLDVETSKKYPPAQPASSQAPGVLSTPHCITGGDMARMNIADITFIMSRFCG